MADFDRLSGFCLIVGNARSGSTLAGSLLDAHPRICIANEAPSSQRLWRGVERDALLAELVETSRHQAAEGRVSEGYGYAVPGLHHGGGADLRVVGDKVWNPATLLLHGDPGLLKHLEACVGVPLYLIHAVRNPFDAIGTMHRRSGASLADRARWFFMHCDAVAAIRARWPAERYLDLRHEDLVVAPNACLTRLCAFLGQDAPSDYLDACARFVFATPRRTRGEAPWEDALRDEVERRMLEFEFLAGYSFAS
jgi:hypothetical protein